MKRLKWLNVSAVLVFASLALGIPFMRTTPGHAMPGMGQAQIQMPMPVASLSGCISYCASTLNVPIDPASLNQSQKELEREPSLPPVNHWQLFASVSLAALFIMLPVLFKHRFYKDPKLILATQLRI